MLQKAFRCDLEKKTIRMTVDSFQTNFILSWIMESLLIFATYTLMSFSFIFCYSGSFTWCIIFGRKNSKYSVSYSLWQWPLLSFLYWVGAFLRSLTKIFNISLLIFFFYCTCLLFLTFIRIIIGANYLFLSKIKTRLFISFEIIPFISKLKDWKISVNFTLFSFMVWVIFCLWLIN
jgi:hypothetical protein